MKTDGFLENLSRKFWRDALNLDPLVCEGCQDRATRVDLRQHPIYSARTASAAASIRKD